MAAFSVRRTPPLVLSNHEQDDWVGATGTCEPFKHETAGELRSGKEAAEFMGQHADAGGDFIRGHLGQLEHVLHDLPYVPAGSCESFVMVHVRWP